MDAQKAEFKRLIKSSGWSQTEAAKRLGKTPSAINHLINPDHANKPTQTTLRLLKLIIARERSDLFTARTVGLKGVANSAVNSKAQFSAKERDLIQRLRELTAEEQEEVYTIISTLLLLLRRQKIGKQKRTGF
jgi:predicted transcriptional regulator